MTYNKTLISSIIVIGLIPTISSANTNANTRVIFSSNIINSGCTVSVTNSHIDMGTVSLKQLKKNEGTLTKFVGEKQNFTLQIANCPQENLINITYSGNIKNGALANDLNDPETAAQGLGIVITNTNGYTIIPNRDLSLAVLTAGSIKKNNVRTLNLAASYKDIGAVEKFKAGEFSTTATIKITYP